MSQQGNPFKRTTIIIMFAVGFAAFIALLYGIGTGDRLSSGKDGQAHGASNSIVGYKALANLLEKTGREVRFSRSAADIDEPGLLILTPNAYAEADKIDEVVQERAYIGPTMIILPKWQVVESQILNQKMKKGWVTRFNVLGDDSGAAMLKDIVDIELEVVGESGAEGLQDIPAIEQKKEDRPARKSSKKKPPEIAQSAVGPPVPLPETHLLMTGDYVRTIVADPDNGAALIAYLDDGGIYPALDRLDPTRFEDEDDIDGAFYPVVIVADADLMNNAGMADKRVARHALALIDAVEINKDLPVIFDLTFNGLGTSDNLLTLAFKPPFLSATICLIIAALAAAWMAFNRFGPPTHEKRSIDFGKTALVNNSAGFISRMQRQYLVADPYGELIRDDAISALGIPAGADRAEANRKLDELGEVDGYRFTQLLNALNASQNSRETADNAAALYHWKKEKIG